MNAIKPPIKSYNDYFRALATAVKRGYTFHLTDDGRIKHATGGAIVNTTEVIARCFYSPSGLWYQYDRAAQVAGIASGPYKVITDAANNLPGHTAAIRANLLKITGLGR